MCNFVKGMAAGMVLGACAAMGMGMDRRSSRRVMHKAARRMNDMLDNFTDNLGL